MVKDKKSETEITFNPKKVIKKTNENIKNLMSLSFKVENLTYNKVDRFKDIRVQIRNLGEDKCLIITNEGTGLTINEVQKQVSNIACMHKRKFIEKNFKTEKVDDTTLRLYRLKDKVIK